MACAIPTLTLSFLLGVQWDNLSQPPEQMGMTFGWVCWMILFDSGLYFVCGWYLNNLVPGKNSASEKKNAKISFKKEKKKP